MPLPDDETPATRSQQIWFWLAVLFVVAMVLLTVAYYVIGNGG